MIESLLNNAWIVICIVLVAGNLLHNLWVHFNDMKHIKGEIALLFKKMDNVYKETSEQGERISRLEGIINNKKWRNK